MRNEREEPQKDEARITAIVVESPGKSHESLDTSELKIYVCIFDDFAGGVFKIICARSSDEARRFLSKRLRLEFKEQNDTQLLAGWKIHEMKLRPGIRWEIEGGTID